MKNLAAISGNGSNFLLIEAWRNRLKLKPYCGLASGWLERMVRS